MIEFDSCNNGAFFVLSEDMYDDNLGIKRAFKCGFIDNDKTEDFPEPVFYQDDECNYLTINDLEQILAKMKELQNEK